ncbi:hypothetical protein Tco_0008796 [Tanacetum coccineum]
MKSRHRLPSAVIFWGCDSLVLRIDNTLPLIEKADSEATVESCTARGTTRHRLPSAVIFWGCDSLVLRIDNTLPLIEKADSEATVESCTVSKSRAMAVRMGN